MVLLNDALSEQGLWVQPLLAVCAMEQVCPGIHLLAPRLSVKAVGSC